MEHSPKVSVTLPTYNYAHFLDETIQSVLNQTFTDFELIIIDNCSTDNTDEVVKKYLTDSRVVYHKNQTNIGLIGNWNKCLELARAQYIKFLCADDKFHPQLLEKFVAIMDQHPGVAIVGSNDEIFGEENYCRISPFKGLTSAHVVQQDLLGIRNRLRNPSVVMFRKKDAMKIGKFNPQLRVLADRDYYFRLLTLGDCYIIPEVLCYVREHSNTQTHAMLKKYAYIIFERYRFRLSVKSNITQSNPIYAGIDADIKKHAADCTTIMYRAIPKLHKKESRKVFKEAFEIGYSEGVLVATVLRYLRRKATAKSIVKSKPQHS